MKEQIQANLDQPAQLEKLYRNDKAGFRRAFNDLFPEIKDHNIAEYWNERLNYTSDEISWGTKNDLLFVVIASLCAGIIAKLPAIFPINEDFFYPRNIGFIVFPFLTAYFAWKNKLSSFTVVALAITMLIGLLFINFLPDVKKSNTLVLSCVHLALVLWSVLGVAFVGGAGDNDERRLGFLKYNGDLIVMTTLILIAGGIMSGITIGLFSLIGFNIAEIYMENVAVFGLAASPVVGTYLTQSNPHLVGKVSPVIAKIFSPLVLIMLVVYISAIMYSGKNPYNNREFLLIFNALLIGVMALIFFSISGTPMKEKGRAEVWILLLLSSVTIIVNGIALSAIVYRIFEWGITPNRAAVLGGNILILVNLVLVTFKLFRVSTNRADLVSVGRIITLYLPVYCLWAAVVTFLFPFLFGFR